MIDDRVTVAIPSYRRAGSVTTLEFAPFATVWVPESQADEYREHYGDRVTAIPDEMDGNIARKRNAILDLAETPYVLMLDDDLDYIEAFEAGQRIRLTPEHFAWLINEGFRMAEEAGVKLWGINQNTDAMTYRTMTPFSFLAAILGPFCGHLEPELRYNEHLAPKEDYDFFLMNIHRYRKTFRLNKYHYFARHGKGQRGGIVGQRSMDLEWRKAREMVRKWGRAFRPKGTKGGGQATGKNILNSRMNIPIPGV